MSRPTWTGRKVTAALRTVLRTHGDTCWLCHHHGADSTDHVLPVETHPELEWEPTNWRPAHLRKATHPHGCAVAGCTCPGNAGRGSKAWTAPPSRTWCLTALAGPVLASTGALPEAPGLPYLSLAACLLALGAWINPQPALEGYSSARGWSHGGADRSEAARDRRWRARTGPVGPSADARGGTSSAADDDRARGARAGGRAHGGGGRRRGEAGRRGGDAAGVGQAARAAGHAADPYAEHGRG